MELLAHRPVSPRDDGRSHRRETGAPDARGRHASRARIFWASPTYRPSLIAAALEARLKAAVDAVRDDWACGERRCRCRSSRCTSRAPTARRAGACSITGRRTPIARRGPAWALARRGRGGSIRARCRSASPRSPATGSRQVRRGARRLGAPRRARAQARRHPHAARRRRPSPTTSASRRPPRRRRPDPHRRRAPPRCPPWTSRCSRWPASRRDQLPLPYEMSLLPSLSMIVSLPSAPRSSSSPPRPTWCRHRRGPRSRSRGHRPRGIRAVAGFEDLEVRGVTRAHVVHAAGWLPQRSMFAALPHHCVLLRAGPPSCALMPCLPLRAKPAMS